MIEGLKGLSILQQPQGTNFRVTDDEWGLISGEIDTRASIEQDNDADIDDAEGLALLREGKIHHFFGRRYERVPQNRREAIRIHGLVCSVCGFDFEKRYGERGKNFIEIHHVKPLSHLDSEEFVDPKTDLFPVCANCHRMIHRRRDSIVSIEEMRKAVR